jgi:hypothetical protein
MEDIEILEKTFNQMGNRFSPQHFNQKAEKNGFTFTYRTKKEKLAMKIFFLKDHAVRDARGNFWVKKNQTEEASQTFSEALPLMPIEVKILQIPESKFNELISKIDKLEQKQNRIFEIASDNTLYSSEEVQKILGTSQKTLQIYRDRKQIEFIQIGTVVRYSKKAIAEFLESNTVKAI